MCNRFKVFRPFSIFLSSSKASISLLATLGLLLPSCTFNPPLQGKGVEELQGEWQQDTSAIQQKLVNYSLYRYKFDCDSFFVQIQTHSKVNYGDDTCMRAGHWTEYAKGGYKLRHDTLRLTGLFCNADFSYKDPGGCFRSGNYEEHFKILKKTDSLYQFTITSGIVPFNVRLKKKITCSPKAL
ncbi:fumarate hydratase [Mucilaginibacter agri]|uniref:Fumarate hydratase n=1 Tax=Mucilaginibacter agri TaxID=2695265 RepID=A0A966DRU0_9SPHI|nr:fumarate hydratase [Mucilaginibacter agri]NCD69443.1 fumarate hydratase [Mucilaginibacter agri]